MLPPNFLTIPQIQREQRVGSKLMHLTALLEYLLRLCNPNLLNEAGREASLGERVNAFKHLFDRIDQVFWAVKVRNYFIHGLETVSYTDRDAQNAINYLIEAIGTVCAQSAIPRNLVAAIYHDPDADVHAQQVAEERRRREQQQAQDAQARSLRTEQEKLERERLQQARRERDLERKAANRVSIVRGLRGALMLGVVAAGAYFLWPKAETLINGSRPTAMVVRTQAELALRKVKARKKQTEYGASITQAEAAWRDAEIEFKKGNYKQAEEKYRQLLSVWDAMNARIVDSMGYDELLAEVNSLRLAARNAQAAQKAAELWNQAEELRRNAITARRNGNLEEAKNLAIQARQQYDAAQAAAIAQTEAVDKNLAGDGGSDGQTPATTPNGQSEPMRTITPVPTPDSQR